MAMRPMKGVRPGACRCTAAGVAAGEPSGADQWREKAESGPRCS